MSISDIIVLIVLFIAYGLTWFLFLRSLKIINLIDKDNLHHIEQIRQRSENRNSRDKTNRDTK